MAEEPKSVGGVILAILLALTTAGSAPWWWPANNKRLSDDDIRTDVNAVRPAQEPHAGPVEPAERRGVLASGAMYRAVIGSQDHCNSDGGLLRDAASIVRQDRANYYGGRRDSADEPSLEFATFGQRDRMIARLQIDPVARKAILTRNPSIAVSQNAGGLRVEVESEGEPFVACQP